MRTITVDDETAQVLSWALSAVIHEQREFSLTDVNSSGPGAQERRRKIAKLEDVREALQ